MVSLAPVQPKGWPNAIQNASIALNIPLETVAREFNNLSINGIEGTRELKRRGLENILGFTDGIKRDSKTAVAEFLKVFGANGQFGLASNAFANTFEGATNRFFNAIKDIKQDWVDLKGWVDTSRRQIARHGKEAMELFARPFDISRKNEILEYITTKGELNKNFGHLNKNSWNIS